MKIVEFGDDGKPRLLQQGGSQPPGNGSAGRDGVRNREFSPAAASSATAETGRIRIREFGTEADAASDRTSSAPKPGPFGAARVPQSIKIVDFDKDKGRPRAMPAAAAERPRGMKIIETE